jgi:hypothetical protein
VGGPPGPRCYLGDSMSADATCAICGRTILAGERVHGYVEGSHERAVCELCMARAEGLGWRPAGAVEPERPPLGREGQGRLWGLLRRSSRRRGAPLAEPSSSLPQTDPAATPKRSRPAPALDGAAANPTQRAVARFNSSEAGRTVAGLVRTLGAPWVSVGALAGSPEEIRITVAWELSWYQWGIDIGDELRPVFQIDKGQEIDQLDPAARQWNASTGDGGEISLGSGQRPAAGEPAAG